MSRMVIDGMVVVGIVMTMVVGCSWDDRRDRGDRGDGFQRFLTDPEKLNGFPVDERRQLRGEYNRLPKSVMVRVPTEGGRHAPEQAEVRYFDRRVDFDDDSVPMHRRWEKGRDSDRIAIGHHMAHMSDHRKFRRNKRHYSSGHYNNSWRYRSYTPYYRSAYNSNYWWDSYTFYRNYRIGNYEYCVFYPRYSSYRYYYPKYHNYYGY